MIYADTAPLGQAFEIYILCVHKPRVLSLQTQSTVSTNIEYYLYKHGVLSPKYTSHDLVSPFYQVVMVAQLISI